MKKKWYVRKKMSRVRPFPIDRVGLPKHRIIFFRPKYNLIYDKLQYDFHLISSKHWDVTGYTFANISNPSRL